MISYLSLSLSSITPFFLLYLIPTLYFTYIILNRLFRLYKNHALIKHLAQDGIPIIFAPWTWQDPLWLTFGPALTPYLLNLPFFRSWIWCSYMGWTTRDAGRAHLPKSAGGRGLGSAFILVSPNRTEFFCTDPKATVEVGRDWRTYEHPEELYSVFGVFGANVNTVNGSDWSRHRKITGGAFLREATLAMVWKEGRRQARGLATELLGGGSNSDAEHGNKKGKGKELTITQVRTKMSLLTMSVLSVAAFGKAGAVMAEGDTSSTSTSIQDLEPGHRLTYFECSRIIFDNLLGVIMFGTAGLTKWLLPKSLRKIKLAVDEYRLFLREAVERHQTEHKDDNQGGVAGTDLASLLIKANEAEKALHLAEQQRAAGTTNGTKAKGAENRTPKSYLTQDELYGNMFMFNVAGYETTSMALSFTMAHLALNEWAWEWLREEVEAVRNDNGMDGLESYELCFEGLVRCRAVMVSLAVFSMSLMIRSTLLQGAVLATSRLWRSVA